MTSVWLAGIKTVSEFNAACQAGHFDHSVLDDCHTDSLTPVKSHWALPIDTPPYLGYALRPGITFTYLGVQVDQRARICFRAVGDPQPAKCANLFAAGEIMAGNILGQGYLAGFGMTLGTAFGRLAGKEAARAAA